MRNSPQEIGGAENMEKAKIEKDPFIKDEGWNQATLYDIGWDEFAGDAKRLFYEIENCQRGSYAEFGDTGEDLLNKLLEMKEAIECLMEEMEAKLPD